MSEHLVEHFWILGRIKECVHHCEENEMQIQKLLLSHHNHVYSILE